MGRKRKVKEEDLEISNIKSFYFTYTNGYMINSYTRYQIVIEEEKYIAKIKPYGKSEDEEKEIEINQDFIEKIVTILKKYEVTKWDGFNKSDHDVMDGDSFSISITMINDKSINASGYMKWPNNFRNVRDEISVLFMNLYNE